MSSDVALSDREGPVEGPTGGATAGKREEVRIPLPKGFDPAKHQGFLLRKLAERRGDGWKLDLVEPVRRARGCGQVEQLGGLDPDRTEPGGPHMLESVSWAGSLLTLWPKLLVTWASACRSPRP